MAEMLTKDFSADEMRCPCGKCDGGKMQPEFMNMLQALRDSLGVPLHIDSGFRCQAHNRAVGGEPDSHHTLGRAADVAVPTSAARFALVAAALRLGFTGIGIARTYVHLDNRTAKDGVPCNVMWDYYTKRAAPALISHQKRIKRTARGVVFCQ